MAGWINEACDKAWYPNEEDLWCLVGYVNNGSHTTEYSAKVMEKGIRGVIMWGECYIKETDDHQPYHDAVFLITALEEGCRNECDHGDDINGEIYLMRDQVGGA